MPYVFAQDSPKGKALAAQLTITRAVWSSLGDSDATFTAYAEQLGAFTPEEIEAGFVLARERADRYYPRPRDVRRACGEHVRRHAQAPPGAAPPVSFCGLCGARDLYDDGSAFGRLSVAHKMGCAQATPLPPGARLWIGGTAPASFLGPQLPEVEARLDEVRREAMAKGMARGVTLGAVAVALRDAAERRAAEEDRYRA